MKLTASPFNPQTGELLPVYRDAYLRGDLAHAHTRAVDAYLKTNGHSADDTLRRFYEMKQQGEQVRPVGWVQRQFELIRTEPKRFRQRAAAMVVGGALLGGAVFAGTSLPNEPVEENVVLLPASAEAAEASSALLTMTVRGRILDENGKPLVGATVLQKGTFRGVSTNADGSYSMRVPVGQNTLVYGYGGYTNDEVQISGSSTQNVTLLPRDKAEQKALKKARRWWSL
ncbi:carboxypeptidase-like regulatory domain-containing protein [Hymenobacter chitinivorans]|uniref:Carboxypeptidase-like protein n=1 Tax=Hymenobacter chitinivorans DSM 11115 TaxID=1121954 RepID=A0A2M9B5L5_9BACT|nr:carboxypeptidase-like regulatory domain-containing protein [Hymenobacter chitinivorans]PJJ53236.1 carboxypeptidase-like protein [Hymenobacter chitinivorans DSM 11115]